LNKTKKEAGSGNSPKISKASTAVSEPKSQAFIFSTPNKKTQKSRKPYFGEEREPVLEDEYEYCNAIQTPPDESPQRFESPDFEPQMDEYFNNTVMSFDSRSSYIWGDHTVDREEEMMKSSVSVTEIR
jgi:hypothetical protein